MDKATLSVTDFFLPGEENERLEHLRKLISGYLSSHGAGLNGRKAGGAKSVRAGNPPPHGLSAARGKPE